MGFLAMVVVALLSFALEGVASDAIPRKIPANQTIDYKYPRKHVVSVDGNFLGSCLRHSMENSKLLIDYTLRPFYRDNFRGKSACPITHDSLMEYLMAGAERCDYETGKESKLRDWILSQRDNSIDPVRIFEHSLKLNNGRVFDAVLTIHQLLRNEARWFSKKFYLYESDRGAADSFWNKFIDLRGSLASRNERGFEGDHEGSWYRIWGIMLPQLYVKARPISEVHCIRLGQRFATSMMSQFRAVAAEGLKYIIDIVDSDYRAGGDRRGKLLINSSGAAAGSVLVSGRWRLPSFHPQSCVSRGYIRPAAFDY